MADDALTPPPGFTLDSADKPPAGFTLDAAKPNVEPSSAIERVGTGLGDIVWGAGQLASHVVPGVDSGIVDQMAKDRETEYEAKRKAAGSTGVDWARMAGNVANPINLVGGAAAAPASLAGRVAINYVGMAPTLAGRVALGAGVGAAAGALQPATGQGSYWGQKAAQTAAGAATGGVLPVAGAAASRVISPQTSAAVQDLTKRGISPTLGQILGGTAKTMEDKLMSLPIVGDVIAHARRGAVGDLNKSLYNMALEPIGETSTAQIGREGVKEVQQKLSNAYGTLLQGKQIPLDNQFGQEVSNIFQNVSGIMSNDAKEQFMSILKNRVLNARNPQGFIDGEAMKAIDTQLGQFSSKFGRQQDVNSQMIGDGLDQVQQALRDAVGRADPALQEGLNKVNQGWSIYARIRNAASRTGSKEGVVLPGTLNAAVTKLDNSVAKGGTATGTAPMRQFTDHINEVLGGQYPDSGTAGRTLLNVLLTGGGMYLHPTGMMLAGAAALPSIFRKTTAAAMTKRPAIAPAIAEGAETAAQYLAPGMGQVVGRIQGQ